MREIGTKVIYDKVDLEIDFDINDLFDHFDIEPVQFINGLLDKNERLDLEKMDKLVKLFVNAKVKEKFGDDYEAFYYYDTMTPSWNVQVDAITHIIDNRQ